MKKFLLTMIFLGIFAVPVLADSQTVTVTYTVPARIEYMCNGHSLTVSVNCGERLMEPGHDDLEGYRFVGWKNRKTGLFWNFNDPVSEHMQLDAVYEKTGSVFTGIQENENYAIAFVGSLAVIAVVLERKFRNE